MNKELFADYDALAVGTDDIGVPANLAFLYAPEVNKVLGCLGIDRYSSLQGQLILVRVQMETNYPRPSANTPHAIAIRSQPWQAGFQSPHYPGHV